MSSSQLLKKLKSIDYDYRFMALSDLVSDLKQRSWNTTRQIDQIVEAVLNLLEDSSREVQGLAVECLGLLVLKCSTNHIHSILKTLTTKTLETEEEFLDVFPIAFKRVITQLSHDNLHLILNIADRTLPKFIEGILKSKKPETQNACVEIIHHFLFSFGSAIPNYHREIQNVLLKNFEVTTSRKQVIDTISLLCTNIDDNLFSNLIEYIIEKLSKNDKQLSVIYLQLLVVIGRKLGYRIAKHISELVKVLFHYLNDEEFYDEIELMDGCLQSFECFILRCPNEVLPFEDEFLDVSLDLIRYDPNLSDSDYSNSEEDSGDERVIKQIIEMSSGEDKESEISGTGSESEEEFSDDDYSDDDDTSWKVRRASAKCLFALITSRPEMVFKFHKEVSPILISRFSEREDYVKLDIFETFNELLHQTRTIIRSNFETHNMVEVILKTSNAIFISCLNELKSNKVQSRVLIFKILNKLVGIIPSKVVLKFTNRLFNSVKRALLDKSPSNENLKTESLRFFKKFITHYKIPNLEKRIMKLLPLLKKAVKHEHFKISSLTLMICGDISRMILPNSQIDKKFNFEKEIEIENTEQESAETKIETKRETEKKEENKSKEIEIPKELKEIAIKLFDIVFSVFKIQNTDQEVKDASISSISIIISQLGSLLEDRVENAINLFFDRLNNETTRIISLKSLRILFNDHSKFRFKSNELVIKIIIQLRKYLSKQNRIVKRDSLLTLISIIQSYGSNLSSSSELRKLITTLYELMNINELQIAQSGIILISTILSAKPQSLEEIIQFVENKLFDIIKHPVVKEGILLDSAINLYSQIMNCINNRSTTNTNENKNINNEGKIEKEKEKEKEREKEIEKEKKLKKKQRKTKGKKDQGKGKRQK